MPARGATGFRAGVRPRIALAATAVVGVALVVASAILVLALRATLTRGVRDAARLRAQDVAAIVRSGVAPPTLAGGDGEDQALQVLDRGGAVLAASPNVAGRPALARLAAGESLQLTVPFDDDRFLAVAVAVAPGSGDGRTVLVARTLEHVDEAASVVVRLLAAGLPLLLLLVGATAWRAAGRALAPVEAIRREVDAISATQLHRRVPQPGGADEISRLAATMNRMVERLEAAQGRQRRFVSDAAHELRSPVAAIRQHAEVALAHPDPDGGRDLAADVLAEAVRLGHVVENLLVLARIDEGGSGWRRVPVDLDDVVLAEAARLRATTELQVDTAGVSAGRVSGDEAAMRGVVRNLVDNAARHARGRVGLSLQTAGGSVRLAVDDDGPGVPIEHRERVFERFVRLDDDRSRDGGGAGLGLAIVAEVVAAHRGSVAVGDSPLGGARVEVALPSAEPPG